MDDDLITRAVSLAATAHGRQKDKGGSAYILHPMRIAYRCKTDDERIVAMLHDVCEDGAVFRINPALIKDIFPLNIADAVDAITRKDCETYMEYISRCYENDLAKKVKILDLEDNMNILRIGNLKDDDVERLNKYKKAYKFLTE